MIEIRQTEVFEAWFAKLEDSRARTKILVRIRRLSLGNPGDAAPVGEGVSEFRIHYGPGYRVYFLERGESLVILLAGGDKSSQKRDIAKALRLARDLQERAMAKTKTRRWDPAEHLETAEEMAAYLEAAFEEDDPSLIAAVLGDIARAKGMTAIARDAGLGRESLYKALSTEGNPEFATVMKVVRALGLRLHATAE